MRNWLILITLLVVGALFVPAVSAETIPVSFSELPYTDIVEKVTLYDYKQSFIDSSSYNPYSGTHTIVIYATHIENWQSLTYMTEVIPVDIPQIGELTQPKTLYYKRPSDNTPQEAVLYIQKGRNALGQAVNVRFTLFPQEWAVGSATGAKSLVLYTNPECTSPYTLYTSTRGGDSGDACNTGGANFIGLFANTPGSRPIKYSATIAYAAVGANHFKQVVNIDSSGMVDLNVERWGYLSTVSAYADGVNIFTRTATADLNEVIPTPVDNVTISLISTAAGVDNTYVVSGVESAEPTPTPESGHINLYVKNSQTGALISGCRAVISAGFYDPAELIEVSNTTLAGGTKTYTLQPTGGGLPNPDYYRIFVTADGYNSELPYVDTDLEAGLSITMVLGMEPTAGAPEDPGYTYIDVYVRDIYANPIADATVKMGAYTLKTNAAGYTLFDVPKNTTYPYTVKKTGYTSIEGSVTVADAARYPVNIVMGTGVIPTNTPTPQPTVPGATPTVPADEETPGTGFMEQSGQAMATFFGVPLAIGKMILGLLIALAIGMATAKQLKGGAAEFGIGLLGGAMIGIVVGLIPTWVIVVLLLTVGLYIGKMYMSGDAGGR